MSAIPPLKIDDEFRSLLPPLDEDTRARLIEQLERDGCTSPLIVWKEENILLDGHNRKDICDPRKIEYKLKHLSFPSRHEAKLWAIRENLARRHLNDYARTVAILACKEMIAAEAKRNQELSEGRGKKGPQKSANLKPIDTRQELAKAGGSVARHDLQGRVHREARHG
jgi:hypothetical protein